MRLPERARGRLGQLGRRASAAWNGAPLAEPWRGLAPLLLVHWLALLAFALFVARRNGWLFYQGGDQIWYWSNAWFLGHGLIPPSAVSFGWPVVLLPIALISGPMYLDGLPVTILLQVLVLAPIALWSVYEIAARTAGRLIGYVTAAVWTVLPYLVIPFWDPRYHAKFIDNFLPQALGLSGMSDYASMVFLMLAAALALRAYESGDQWTAALAGVAAGFGASLKASSLIFAPIPLIVLLARGRSRAVLAYALATVPAWIALALWKYRGLGTLPAFSSQADEVRVALGANFVTTPYDKYVHVDFGHLNDNLLQLREFFYSVRILEWAPIAGALAVARRSPRLALFLSVWFWAFLILKGAQPLASVENTSFFRFLLPGFPAFLILAISVPLLIPRVGPTLAERFATGPPRPIGPVTVAVAIAVLGVVPLAAIAAGHPMQESDEAAVSVNGILVPVEKNFGPNVEPTAAGVVVSWTPRTSNRARVFYRLLRAKGPTDADCVKPSKGAVTCTFVGEQLSSHRDTSTLDRPGKGTWTYRIGVAANYLDDAEGGDVFLVSRPVTVKVP